MDNSSSQFERIKANISTIIENIESVALNKNIDPKQINIIGVTKNRTPGEIDLVVKAGIKIIAENKVQEAESKLPLVNEPYSSFHYIGHLQRNKIKKLLPLKPALIHSIDSLRTAEKLDQYLRTHSLRQDILVQINTSGENSKFGLDDDCGTIDQFLYNINKLDTLNVRGLMTLAINSQDESKVRGCFIRLRNQFERINDKMITNEKLDILSMGMSNDYLIAIEEGANMIRIGSAIFN